MANVSLLDPRIKAVQVRYFGLKLVNRLPDNGKDVPCIDKIKKQTKILSISVGILFSGLVGLLSNVNSL